jgi:glycosyltransferase involved in cell wall biosynthesis
MARVVHPETNAASTPRGGGSDGGGERDERDDPSSWRAEANGGQGGTVDDAPVAPPLVSVGLPVFNGERYLERAVRSVLEQDFGDFELIIVDNASDDATADIARRFAASDPRVRYHRNAENIGAARNHQAALALARGRYFKWTTYDDWLEPSFLRRCVDVLEREPDVALVFPSTNVWDEEGNLLTRYRHPSEFMSARASRRYFNALWNWKYQTGIYGLMRTADVRAATPMESYKGADRVLFAEFVLTGGVLELDEYLFNSTEATSVRKGRGAVWWTGKPSDRPRFDRFHLLADYVRLAARTPHFNPVERVLMVSASILFFCRAWPRRALYAELRAGAEYGWGRVTRPLARVGLARRGSVRGTVRGAVRGGTEGDAAR